MSCIIYHTYNHNVELFACQTFDAVVSGVLALGLEHTLVLKYDGTVWATGGNMFGQLGIDWRTQTTIANFVEVVSGDATAVATGNEHSMVLKKDGSIWATGSNMEGQLGDGSTITTNTFARLPPLNTGSRHDHTHMDASSPLHNVKRAALCSRVNPVCLSYPLPFAPIFTI